MSDEKHEHGTMNTDVQEKTFAAFMSWTVWAVVVILVALVLLYMVNG